MKNLSLITAGLMAIGLVSTASATTTYYITGSSAYRGNVNAALLAGGSALGLDGASVTVPSTAYGVNASSLVFSNTISGNPILIKTSFTGSEAGIASLVGANGTTLIDPTTANANAPIPGTPLPTFLGDNGTSTGANAGTHSPDLAMADTSQNVSRTTTPTLNTVGGAPVGIVQFVWMKGTNVSQVNYSHLANLTIPQLNVLFGAGQLDLSFFTGVSDDYGTTIKLVGRNYGSGTRVNCLIESLYGITKSVSQFAPNPTYAANGSLNKVGISTSLTESSFVNIGNDGYDSGGGVANTLFSTGTFACIPVGYIGLVDATTTVSGVSLTGSALTGNISSGIEGGYSFPNPQVLTLNGVAYSDQAIVNGAYDYYGHEHMYSGAFSNPNAVTFGGKLFTVLQSTLTGGVNGIPIVDLEADRPSEGDTGFVTPGYTATN